MKIRNIKLPVDSSHWPKMTTGFSRREKKIDARSSFSFFSLFSTGCRSDVDALVCGEADRFFTFRVLDDDTLCYSNHGIVVFTNYNFFFHFFRFWLRDTE